MLGLKFGGSRFEVAKLVWDTGDVGLEPVITSNIDAYAPTLSYTVNRPRFSCDPSMSRTNIDSCYDAYLCITRILISFLVQI